MSIANFLCLIFIGFSTPAVNLPIIGDLFEENFIVAKIDSPILAQVDDIDVNMLRLQGASIFCTLCSEPIAESNLAIGCAGRSFHMGCLKKCAICEYCGCGFPANQERLGIRYPDGRYICQSCLKTVVPNNDSLNNLSNAIIERLAGVGMTIDTSKIRLTFVSKPKLFSLTNDQVKNPWGYTIPRDDQGRFAHEKASNVEIYVLDSMPVVYTVIALAHESAHAWRDLYGHFSKSNLFIEGCADYAAYLVMDSLKGKAFTQGKDRLLNNDDPARGPMLRKIKKFVDDIGIKAWIEYYRMNDGLPAAY